MAVAAPAWAHNYVGAQACGSCHAYEYQVWLQGPHARAHLSLTPEQQQDGRCTSCHSNAQMQSLEILPSESMTLHEPGTIRPTDVRAALALAGNAALAGNDKMLGVQCEACHGPGALYQPEYVMRDRELSRLVGLVDPTPASCLACHNEGAPSLASFNYKRAWALIDHGREAREAFEAKLAAKAPHVPVSKSTSAAELEVDDDSSSVSASTKRAVPNASDASTTTRARARHRRTGPQRGARSLP